VNGVKTFLLTKLGKEKLNFFCMVCNFVTTCHDKNEIHDSMIYFFFIWWCGASFYVIITWDLIYSCHNFQIRNYIMQHVTIQMIKKHFIENISSQLVLFYQNHNFFCILIKFVLFQQKPNEFGYCKNIRFLLVTWCWHRCGNCVCCAHAITINER
jgi:hypothetical protein